MYKYIKCGYKGEAYVNADLLRKYKSAITKFRISAHRLPIEEGRMRKVDRKKQTCPFCDEAEIGDERHYLLRCSKVEFKEFRDTYLGHIDVEAPIQL